MENEKVYVEIPNLDFKIGIKITKDSELNYNTEVDINPERTEDGKLTGTIIQKHIKDTLSWNEDEQVMELHKFTIGNISVMTRFGEITKKFEASDITKLPLGSEIIFIKDYGYDLVQNNLMELAQAKEEWLSVMENIEGQLEKSKDVSSQ